MKKFLVASIAAAAFLSAPAFAADMPVKAAPTPLFNWSGWYWGANIGYGFGSDQANFDPLDAGAILRASFMPGSVSLDPRGVLGGLQFGVNKQVGNIVYGVETDFSYSGIKNTTSVTVTSGSGFTTTTQEKLDWFGTVRARAGVTAVDRSLIYLTGGLAYGRAAISDFSTVVPAPGGCANIANFCVIGSSEKWMAGWTIGGGWEYAFAPNWSAKIEYLYYDLGKISANLPGTFGPGTTFRESVDVKGNIVRVGWNYKFGM